MFSKLITRIFGTKHDRQIKKVQPLVARINELEASVTPLSDDQLRARTAEFREKIERGASLDDILPEAFATVREAARRVMGMRHYDVQLVGGIALHRGMIAEMRTGEGKTLTATSALYLNALSGRGAHLITVNDYLAARDAEWMGRVYRFLGLSVGTIVHGLSHIERQRSYRADITYGTNNEFGFDYLRDNMKETIEKYVQRELNFAIVDEVDSILIDEARTPLIISGESSKPATTYIEVDRVIPSLRRDLDFNVDEKHNQVQFTDAGVDRLEKLLKCTNLYAPENNELLHHVNQALRAHVLYKKDVNYLVENGEVVIVDEFTGRKMEGRRWSDGLHQAIEAKEGVPIQPESQTLATITYQNYFRMYNKLSGMTGTADTEADEFHKIYNLDVMVIPPNRTISRIDHDDLVYKNERGKFAAVIEQIRECHGRGQPVLVGTTSVEKSQLLHAMLTEAKIPHSVLNAKEHGREATIIAQAGRKYAVTVATNMAGRGTDIILGGNAEMMASIHYDPAQNPEEYEKLYKGLKEQSDEERDEVKALGGLFIVGTERHESRRIDNQLRGRAGRQGDPGASRFFLSLQDDLMRIFQADRLVGLMERLGMEEDVPIEAPMVNKAIRNAQSKVEAMHFDTRKNLFEYDNVMNEQRKAIYLLRRQILEGRYQPEILDEETRKEQASKLAPPPEKSGKHTRASMRDLVRNRVEGIIDNHCRILLQRAGLPADGPNPFPETGVNAEGLTHDLYRHYGAMVSLADVRMSYEKVLDRSLDVVAASLIQQRERIHELAYKHVDELVVRNCPSNVHPDEWNLSALTAELQENYYVEIEITKVSEKIEDLIDQCWKVVEASLIAREEEFGLYTFLFYVRQIYLREIDEQWIAHLKNIEHLRTGIGLVGYATKNPKNEYKIRAFSLFKEMWHGIERSTLDQVLQMRLSAAERERAEEGAEYETAVTVASERREKQTARQRGAGELEKIRAAASREVEKLVGGAQAAAVVSAAPAASEAQKAAPSASAAASGENLQKTARRSSVPKVGRNDPCPCGSGKLYKKCHGATVEA
jgi:preprotein translocase subunit SecA